MFKNTFQAANRRVIPKRFTSTSKQAGLSDVMSTEEELRNARIQFDRGLTNADTLRKVAKYHRDALKGITDGTSFRHAKESIDTQVESLIKRKNDIKKKKDLWANYNKLIGQSNTGWSK